MVVMGFLSIRGALGIPPRPSVEVVQRALQQILRGSRRGGKHPKWPNRRNQGQTAHALLNVAHGFGCGSATDGLKHRCKTVYPQQA
jgi:hypothetical protein